MPREALVVDKLADLAQGGMGSVEIGVVREGRLAGRVLAIKRLHEDLARDPEIVSMFVDEAWLTAQIDDPHVVRVEAFAEDARGLFLATELVRGVSLGRLMAEARAREEPFAERTVAFIASQTCAGLSAAHDLRDSEGTPLGLVHRDLTPGNVLVSFDGVVKITDFGIAKAERRVSANTRMGVLKGKPSYVSPEQVRGGAIDARADLFALGIVLFELLAGRRPWRGKDDTDVLIAMMRTEPPRLAELRPNVSPALGHLVDACLRKRPEERPQSAAEVRAAVDAFRNERGFATEDAASLAAFVARNTTELSSWFDEALGGALSRGGRSLQQAEREVDATRVQASPLAAQERPAARTPAAVEDDTTNDHVPTAAFQHAGPLPGAEAMIAAMRGPATSVSDAAPDSPRTVAFSSEQAARGLAIATPRTNAATQFMPQGAPVPGPAAAFSRVAASTPVAYPGSPKTELLQVTTPMHPPSQQRAPGSAPASHGGPASASGPGSNGVGATPPSSAPRSPPVTEWMSTPPSQAHGSAALPAPRGAAPSGLAPIADGASGMSLGAITRPSEVTRTSSNPGGPAGAWRIALVFVLVFALSVAGVGALLRFGVIHLP